MSHNTALPSVEYDTREELVGENTHPFTEYVCSCKGEQGSSLKSRRLHKRTVLSPPHVAKVVLLKATPLISLVCDVTVCNKVAWYDISDIVSDLKDLSVEWQLGVREGELLLQVSNEHHTPM